MLHKSMKAAAQLNTLTNVQEQDSSNSSKLVEIEDIENTPFKLVTTENGSFIGYGNNRLSELKETKEEALKIVEEKSWDFIGTFVISLITSFNNYKNENK